MQSEIGIHTRLRIGNGLIAKTLRMEQVNEPPTFSLHHRPYHWGWCFLSCPATDTPIEQLS